MWEDVLIAAQPGSKSGPHSYRPGTAAVVRFFLPQHPAATAHAVIAMPVAQAMVIE